MSRRLSSRLRDRGMILRACVLAAVEPLESRWLLTAAPAMNPGGAPNGPYNLDVFAEQSTVAGLDFTDNADNETGFVIERATEPTAAMDPLLQFTPIATLPASPGVGQMIGFSDPTVAPNTTYFYQVHAVNGTYNSSLLGPKAVTTPADNSGTGGGGSGTPNPGGPPNGPYNIAVMSQSGTPQISFIDNATNETNLFVQCATSTAGPWFNVAVLPPSPGSGQTVITLDTTAAANTTYFYRAYAVNGPYQSSIAGPISFTTATGGTTFTGVPNGPYNLTAVATGSTSAQLTFTNNADNESRFVVERDTQPGFANSTIINVPQTAAVGQQITYSDTGLAPQTTYFYRVYAANDVHLSGPSGTVFVLTPLAASTAQYGLDGTFGTSGLAGAATPLTQLADVGLGVQPDGGIIVGSNNGSSFLLKRYTAAGVLDPNFGTGGLVVTGLNGGQTGKNVAIQSDGKIVIAGSNTSFGHAGSTLVTERLTSDGRPDSTFGVGGLVITDVAPFLSSVSDVSVAIAPDGKVVAGGEINAGAALGESVFAVRLGSTGVPDATFGNQGVALAAVPLPGGAGAGSTVNVTIHDVAVGPADQVVVAGTLDLIPSRPEIVAFDANGNLIPHTTSVPAPEKFPDAIPSATSETVTAVAIQSDGKTVIAGTANGADGYVARYNADGTLDASFGSGGVVDATLDPSLYLTSPADLRLQPDGKILVGGVGRNSAPPQPAPAPQTAATNFYLARLTTNGVFDTTFSPTGVLSTVGGGNEIDAIALSPGGGIVAVGDGGSLLARYVPGGTGGFVGGVPNGPFNLTAASQAPGSVALEFFDNSTNETGFEIDRAGFSGNHRGDFSPLATLAAQPGTGPVTFVDTTAVIGMTYQYRVRAVDGAVYASDYVIAQAGPVPGGNVAANGSAHLDHTFGVSGTVFDATLPGAVHVAVQPGGKFIVEMVQTGFVVLARYNPNGSPDPSFGTNGVVSTAFEGGRVPGLGIQSDGKIVIAGGGLGQNDFQSAGLTTSPSSAVAERFTADGVLDTTFGANGEYRISFLPTFETGGITTLAVASDDRIALVGSVSRDLSIPPSSPLIIVLSPDGKQTINYTSNAPQVFFSINEVAAAFGPGDSLSVVGNDGHAFYGTRYQPVGSTAPSGVFQLTPGFAASNGLGVTVQNDGKTVAVGNVDASALLARFNNDLTLDQTFAVGGESESVSPPVSRTNAASYDAALILPDGSILAAGQYKKNSAVNGDLLLSKFNSNGLLDTAFASEGSIATDIGGSDDNIVSIAREPDGSIIGAGVSFGHLVLIKYALT